MSDLSERAAIVEEEFARLYAVMREARTALSTALVLYDSAARGPEARLAAWIDAATQKAHEAMAESFQQTRNETYWRHRNDDAWHGRRKLAGLAAPTGYVGSSGGGFFDIAITSIGGGGGSGGSGGGGGGGHRTHGGCNTA